MIRNLLISGAITLTVLAAVSAQARVDLDVNLGGAPAYIVPAPAPVYAPPPVYVQPAPVYGQPYPYYYDPYHRNRDWRYWQARRHEEERRRYEEIHRHDGYYR